MSAVISPTWPWAPNLAPEWLKQSFNNGWTFGNIIQVTNQNSSAPEVEREVVSEHSYGRQIGRLMDAVVALSEKVPGAGKDERVSDLVALAKDIEAIKEAARRRRLTELLEELKSLKQHDRAEWDRLMKAVRD
ncbi:hypothetical protein [Piscinibacter terrae]|uniref:Uncharacterized protein n=1 Tax=Piscinibacter terrae TaxID=2496871 RepID=A0A3N7HSK9_9BURK|nr:hypothetical protein [Albitalea terrae]RQP23811.1 hypothetical protein DZC73_16975 [Albitalea terrae]